MIKSVKLMNIINLTWVITLEKWPWLVDGRSVDCRAIVGRWSVNGRSIVGRWSVDGRLMVGWWLVDGCSMVGQWLINGWSMVGQWSVNGRSMVSQQSVKFGEIWSKLVKFSHFSLFGQFSQTRASLYLTAFSRINVWDTK